MGATSLFFTMTLILSMFNVYVMVVDPTYVSVISMGILTTLLVAVVVIVFALGFRIEILGSGLSFSETSVNMVLGMGIIISIMFQVNIPIAGGYSFPIGIGLLSTVFEVFGTGEFFGFTDILVYLIGTITLISGMMMISNMSGGE